MPPWKESSHLRNPVSQKNTPFARLVHVIRPPKQTAPCPAMHWTVHWETFPTLQISSGASNILITQLQAMSPCHVEFRFGLILVVEVIVLTCDLLLYCVGLILTFFRTYRLKLELV